MSISKYAAIRYRIIDQLIGNKYNKYPTKEDLRQACEQELYGSTSGSHISDSTIEKDLQYMKLEYDAPIKYSRAYGGYYYSEEGYSIDLNSEQIEAIKMAANVLSQFRNTEVFASFHSAIDKILDRVNISTDLQDNAIRDYVQFEEAPVVLGTEFLGVILEAIKNKKTIILDYKKFQNETVKKRTINPYVLKEYRNRWYVIGFDKTDGFVKTYGLDRIEKVDYTQDSFMVDAQFDIDRFFEYNLGIASSEEEPEEVIISMTPLEGKYAKSQPLHQSQEVIVDNDQECRIKLTVYITKELVMAILALGSEVKVISPQKLIDQLTQDLNKSIDLYKN